MQKLRKLIHFLILDTYFRPEPLPDRVFRGKFMVLSDKWSMELANQNSLRFQHKARDYRERINLTLRRSDLREAYEGSEILALDGYVARPRELPFLILRLHLKQRG